MNDRALEILGERVRGRRKSLGWTQEELAARADIDRSYIGGVERGTRNLTFSILCQICSALECDVASLTGACRGNMKWLRTLILFDQGDVVSSADWKTLHDSYVRAIQSVDFPEGAGTLTLRRKFQMPNKQWNRNGVVYLKQRFFQNMQEAEGWEAEANVDLSRDREQPAIRLYPSLEPYREPITSNFGGFDLMTTSDNGTKFAIEWETGNISSSHRSLNKLAIALAAGVIQAGVMIVPSREFYGHLTDRIGNIGELSGYLAMWESMKFNVKRGLLALTVVEHDHLTDNDSHPYLPTGMDGRSKEGRSK